MSRFEYDVRRFALVEKLTEMVSDLNCQRSRQLGARRLLNNRISGSPGFRLRAPLG